VRYLIGLYIFIPAFDQLSIFALHRNPLLDLPFGANEGGINQAAHADLMHQYLLGIMKRTFKNVMITISEVKKPGKVSNEDDSSKRRKLSEDTKISRELKARTRKAARDRKILWEQSWAPKNERGRILNARIKALNTRHCGKLTSPIYRHVKTIL